MSSVINGEGVLPSTPQKKKEKAERKLDLTALLYVVEKVNVVELSIDSIVPAVYTPLFCRISSRQYCTIHPHGGFVLHVDLSSMKHTA